MMTGRFTDSHGGRVYRVGKVAGLTELSSIRDEPGEGRSSDDWPYPTMHTTYLAGGVLADDVRQRWGMASDTPVAIVEDTVSGGWSEFTQENDYPFTVRCGKHRADFDGIADLIRWLEEPSDV